MLVVALRVAVVAASLALDVFAVGVGIGIRGVTRRQMLRIGCSFAGAEVAMNCIGAVLGNFAGRAIGGVAAYIGFSALIGVGLFMLIEALRDGGATSLDLSSGWGLALASVSISLDSLGVGFSIIYMSVPVIVTLAAIALASGASTFVGIAFGGRIGVAAGERAAVLAGVALMLTGAGFAVAKYASPG